MGTGHVMINRVDNRSMMRCLLHCGDLLKQVCSVFRFCDRRTQESAVGRRCTPCSWSDSWESWVLMASAHAAYGLNTSCNRWPAIGGFSGQEVL